MKTKILTPLTLIILLITATLSAQDCYVVMKIKGTIILEGSGKELQKDDRICGNDNVVFKSSDAVAVVHSESKGRYTLKVSKSRISELEGTLKYTVSTALSKSKSSLDTRSENASYEEELSDRYCIIDYYELKTEESGLTDDNYFLLSFKIMGDPIEIRLRNNGNIVYLEKEILMNPKIKETGQDYIDDAALYLCSESSVDIRKIVDAFDLTIPNHDKLKEELSGYFDLLKASGKTNSMILDELEKYMDDSYGKTNKDSLRLWINKEIMEKK